MWTMKISITCDVGFLSKIVLQYHRAYILLHVWLQWESNLQPLAVLMPSLAVELDNWLFARLTFNGSVLQLAYRNKRASGPDQRYPC